MSLIGFKNYFLENKPDTKENKTRIKRLKMKLEEIISRRKDWAN